MERHIGKRPAGDGTLSHAKVAIRMHLSTAILLLTTTCALAPEVRWVPSARRGGG